MSDLTASWLENISTDGRYEWRHAGTNALKTDIDGRLPCTAVVRETPDGTVLFAAIGRNGTVNYWQWASIDRETSKPIPKKEALRQFWHLLELTALTSKSIAVAKNVQEMKPLDSFAITNPTERAQRVVEYLPIPHNYLQQLEEAAYELCLNVQQWAEAPGAVIVEKDTGCVVITIQDSGRGIPSAMRETFPELSNEDAVIEALTPGVTSSGMRVRGYGLNSLYRLSSRGFVIYVATQDVAVWIDQDHLISTYKGGATIDGTSIQIIYRHTD